MVDHNPLQCKKLFLFDLDGTLYLGDRLFPGVRELLSAIRARGGQYRFLTNNSSRRRRPIFSPRSTRRFTISASTAEKTDAITSAVRSR